MRSAQRRRPQYSARPFFLSTLIITLITTYALFLRPAAEVQHVRSPLSTRAVDQECRLVHQAEDQCAFILDNCQDDEAGLLQYLTFYYCTLGNVQPLAFTILVIWLGLLFTTIGIAASDFFSVNLSTIASILGLSESLAGVTFLAFGNGSPDVFSTFAAMGSNSGSMAVGELIGAAGFITAVVAGSMALVREFKVAKKTFVRDILFFIAAVSFAMVFLADGALNLWECLVMIGFYVFYVVVVVGWHWWSTRRRRIRAKEATSRGHFFGTPGDSNDELEPYNDNNEDDEAAPLNDQRRHTIADISALEIGPRIEIDAAGDGPDEEAEELERHITSQMTSSMRVNRPRGARSNTTITPIRPSLVGVLEFRSILASLQRSGNVHLAPIQGRRQTGHAPGLNHEFSTVSLGAFQGGPSSDSNNLQVQTSGRDRALSSGDVPLNLDNNEIPPPTIVAESPTSDAGDIATADSATPGLGTSDQTPPTHQDYFSSRGQGARSPGLQLQIPGTEGNSPLSSPSLSPFPVYTDSPQPMTAASHGRIPSFGLPTPALSHHLSFPGVEDSNLPKPVRWWPYKILPPPHVLVNTLFPTLHNWSDKTIWDKFVSLISVPSIFLLVMTLPVVENQSDDHDSEDTLVDAPEPGEPGHMAPPVSVERSNSIQPEPETEWQRYRRSTQSHGSRPHSLTASPAMIAADAAQRPTIIAPTISGLPQQPIKPAPGLVSDMQTNASDDSEDWNRWLVALQIFTGPLFTVFIIWANMEESMKLLVRLVLYSLLGSLVSLAILLVTTSPNKRPKYHFMLCFLGFIIAISWISTVAGEVVGVLKAVGVIVGISEAILGLTIFAVGNSVGDLVADITVARLGYPVMALSACFGGPLLNILLGIGIGGAWMTTQAANHKHDKHPDKPVHYKPYHIEVGGTLMISAVTVLITLIFLLIVVPSNKWIMSRKIGFSLIGIWTVSTIINVIVEVTGFWKDVA